MSAAYDASADVLQRLMQTAAILRDVPEDMLLALAGDDFTNLMNEVADISLKFAETPVSRGRHKAGQGGAVDVTNAWANFDSRGKAI